jgi:hypothetical protein
MNMHEYMYSTVYEYFWLPFFSFFLFFFGSGVVKSIDTFSGLLCALHNLCTFEEFLPDHFVSSSLQGKCYVQLTSL